MKVLKLGIAAAMACICSQTLQAQEFATGAMVSDTGTDRMTGTRTAYVAWAAIDSVKSQYSYLPVLRARCAPSGSIDVYVTGVPATNNTSFGSLVVQVKLDGKKPVVWDDKFSVKNDAIWYFNGKQAITKLLLPTDTLLLRFTAVFGQAVTPEFHLGPARRQALETVAAACNWHLPSD